MMPMDHPRIEREKRTVEKMIELYCRGNHANEPGRQTGLCRQCGTLLEYAQGKLGRCPFGAGKTTCAKCPVHCYGEDMRRDIRKVMRYAGPRMLLKHPLLAVMHLFDGMRKRPGGKGSGRDPD